MSIRKEYRHVFFDLDETLWDFKRNSLETIYDLIEQHRLEERGIEKENFIRRYHHHNDIYWDLFRQGKISREELRTVRWKTTLSEFEIDDEVLIKNLSEQYLQLLPNKKNLHDDAIEILNYLKPKYSLHIITNGFEEVQLQKIIMSGMASYFTHIITSERAGSQKPNREIFKYALEISNATITESIFIGDSIEADINGAKAIGMDHVLFNPEKIPHHEILQHEISLLTELHKIL
ncbi:MAG TPA: YjjG family noncanonical pyrimidine nucleotidase [Chitinophagales bacterium]|nr:YjjG family noncanonical pyrimidine nucleotidase [Chitinophagales bacterium]